MEVSESLFRCWCQLPAATYLLCLLARVYVSRRCQPLVATLLLCLLTRHMVWNCFGAEFFGEKSLSVVKSLSVYLYCSCEEYDNTNPIIDDEWWSFFDRISHANWQTRAATGKSCIHTTSTAIIRRGISTPRLKSCYSVLMPPSTKRWLPKPER